MSPLEVHEQRVQQIMDLWLHRSQMRNAWRTMGSVKAYVRRGLFYTPLGVKSGITLANVAQRPRTHGTGRFACLLRWMEAQKGKRIPEGGVVECLLVENVMSLRLTDILLRHGWTGFRHPGGETPSFYKML